MAAPAGPRRRSASSVPVGLSFALLLLVSFPLALGLLLSLLGALGLLLPLFLGAGGVVLFADQLGVAGGRAAAGTSGCLYVRIT